VVYGGWVSIAPVEEYIALLDKNRAWQTLDVLDVHSHGLSSWEKLQQAASTRGFANIGIRQTGIGFTPDDGWVSNAYPRFLHWSLQNSWDEANRYALIDELARSGKAILMVSNYLPEMLGTCDRIAVMNRGILGAARPIEEVDEHTIMLEATGTT
jgi:hypothetical protein